MNLSEIVRRGAEFMGDHVTAPVRKLRLEHRTGLKAYVFKHPKGFERELDAGERIMSFKLNPRTTWEIKLYGQTV